MEKAFRLPMRLTQEHFNREVMAWITCKAGQKAEWENNYKLSHWQGTEIILGFLFNS